MSDDKFMDEIDCIEDDKPRRDLTELARRRWDKISKMAQQQAAELDLLIAESYVAHGKRTGTMLESDLAFDEAQKISNARNDLALTNARMRIMMVRLRKECGMPAHARLRGFDWYDESSGKPVKIVND